MTSLSEQLSVVRQSQWEAQLDMLRTLSTRALDSAEQLIALNMKTSRASMEQATGAFKQMLEANNPRDFYALGSSAQGQWQNVFAYSRELLGIATGVRARAWPNQPLQWLQAPSLPLLPNGVPALPSSVPQVLEQVSIATVGATSIHTEIAAAAADIAADIAADSGAALAEATLHAGTAADTIQTAAEAPAAAVPEVTELDAETAGADPAETPQADDAPADAASAASGAAEAALEIIVPPEAIVDAIVDQAIADAVPPAKATPLAEALNEIAPEPVSARHPIASTIPLENGGAVELPAVEPVDAAPPPQAGERRRAPRTSRKK